MLSDTFTIQALTHIQYLKMVNVFVKTFHFLDHTIGF